MKIAPLLSLAAGMLLPGLSPLQAAKMTIEYELVIRIDGDDLSLYQIDFTPQEYSYAKRTALMRKLIESSGQSNLSRALVMARAGANFYIPQSRYLLALHTKHGIGTEINYATMLEQLTLAARENYAPALYELSRVYQEGLGVQVNEERARNLLHRAAEKGSNEARYARAMLQREMGFDKEATELLLEPAKAGNPDALFELGVAYANGLGIEANVHKAFDCFTQASAKGHIAAMGALRTLYQMGQGCTPSQAKVQELTQQIDTLLVYDHKIQQHAYAFCAANLLANRIVKNEKEGIEILLAKAQQKNAFALHALGHAYATGYGVAKDPKKATQYFMQAYEAGEVAGAVMAAKNLMNSEPQEAEALLRAAAQKGNAQAIATLGRAYLYPEHNPFGFEQSEIKAYELYAQSAPMGDMHSEYILGTLLYNGMGCPQDRVKAREWFAKAAAKNHPHANNVLAKYERFDLLKEGKYSQEQREARARPYYLKAAQLGDAEAQFLMAYIVVNKNPEESVYWLELSAELGYEPAMESLADAYRNGRGATKDFNKAMRMYESLAKNGRQAACLHLADIYAKGEGNTPRDIKKAFYWYKKADRPHLNTVKRQIVDLYLSHELAEEQNPLAAYKILEERLGRLDSFGYDQFLQLEQLLKLKDARFPHLSGQELKHCLQKAKAGDAHAQHQMAVHHLRGAEAGKAQAGQAYEWLIASAKAPTPEILLTLALYHHKGIAGAANDDQAIAYYEKALAAQPDGKMHFFAGLFAHQNENRNHGMSKGKEYMQTASEKGYPDAIFMQNNKLESLLCKDKAAINALSQIADSGHFAAQFSLMHALTGHYAPKDDAQLARLALKYTQKVAEQGYAGAQFKLGVYYQKGFKAAGLEPDRQKAIYWFSQAAEQGHAWSKKRLEKLGQ